MSAVFAAVVALVSDESAEPNEMFLRVAIAAAIVAALYLAATTKAAAGRFPVLAKLPGAPKSFQHDERNPMSQGDKNINYGTQGIGINKGMVHISAPQPSVTAQPLSQNEKTDEGYETRLRIHLDQEYAAQNLVVSINRTEVEKFEVRPSGNQPHMYGTSEAMVTSRSTGQDVGKAFVVSPLSGSDYEAVVVTKKSDLNLEVIVQLNQAVEG